MEDHEKYIASLKAQIEELKASLFEAENVIESIREGSIDALVLNKDGAPQVYSLESADYTYRILIEKFGQGALSISEDGLILYCNDSFSKLLGIPANEIMGTYFNSYVKFPGEFHQLRKALKKGPSKGEIVLHSNGKTWHVYLALTDLHPNVEAIGVVVTDLTDKRKQEEKLVESERSLQRKVNELNTTNKSLEQFIHVISHDIKEPIRKILTYTSFLNEVSGQRLEDGDRKKLDIINTSAVRLNSLVDDLVKYSFTAQIEEVATVNLNKIIKEVTDDLEMSLTERNAEITFDELPYVQSNKVQMRQLFSNLISNAVKYCEKGTIPKISITTYVVDNVDNVAPEQQFYKVQVSDNGIGMDASHLGKIFTIFQRLHMRDEYSGNGIGLAICKKIMENHGGKIEVKSTLGSGSTFYLYFPKL